MRAKQKWKWFENICTRTYHMKIILSLCTNPSHTHFPLTQWHAHQK
jgi:hypothetical protein